MTNNTSPPSCRVLKFTEFAKAIGVSTRQLYRLVDDDKAPRPFYIGRHPRYALEDLETFLEGLKNQRK